MDAASLSPHFVESHLRHSKGEALEEFIRNTAPKFEGFRETRERIITSGKGFDVSLFVAHVDYVRLLEDRVKGLLSQIGVSQESFVNALNRGDENDAVVCALKEFLVRYQSFDSFAEMMEDKFQKLYAHGGAGMLQNSKQQSLPPTPSALPKRYCRVLWDVENVPVPKRLGGLKTVQGLSAFLRAQGLTGVGIDCRITAFFAQGRLSKGVVQALDKAAVELVLASTKREDADRKLVSRIAQEMAILPPSSSVFIIISSDADFRTHLQQLSNGGFKAIVIHSAPESDSAWTESLRLHASGSFRWLEILAEHAGPGTEAAAVEDEGTGDAAGAAASSDGVDASSAIVAPGDVQVHVLDVHGRWVHTTLPRDSVCGLREGTVERWKGPFGFLSAPLKLDPDGPDEPPNLLHTRVYVHTSIISKSSSGPPAKGQKLKVLVAHGDRGLFAQRLDLLEC